MVQESEEPLSNLKLQKLLYYAQGWYLGLGHGTLFTDAIKAWKHGPVVPTVFHEYKHFGWKFIEKPTGKNVALPLPQPARFVKSIVKAYGKYSAEDLRRFTHAEAPWINARLGLTDDDSSTSPEIPVTALKAFFERKARK